jgi:hypothetical protein
MTDSTDPRDDQAEAEATDSDEIDATDFPPEHSMGVGDLLANDVTAADEYAPDTLAIRDRRVNPDVARADDPAVTATAPELDEDGDPAEEDWDVVDPGAVLTDSAAASHAREDTRPAEEAALHIVYDDEGS